MVGINNKIQMVDEHKGRKTRWIREWGIWVEAVHPSNDWMKIDNK